MEPRVNEEPRDWQNVFVVSRLFFIYLVMSRVKKIVRETEDFVIYRGSTSGPFLGSTVQKSRVVE